MKNIAYRIQKAGIVIIISMLMITLFLACEESETVNHTAPKISLVQGANYVSAETTLSVGEQYTVAIHAEYNGDNMLTNFIAKLNGERYIDVGMYKEVYKDEIQLSKGLEETDEWEFIIRDIEGNSASTFLTIHKDQNIEYGEIEEFLNVKLGAQNNTETGSFFSFSDGNDYDLESAFNNQEIIDLVYYYDNFDKLEENIISSPGGNIDDAFTGTYGMSNWTTRNTIRFSREKIDMTTETFDAAANDSILIAHTFDYGSGGRKTKYLEPGDIYSFVTSDNVTGMFKVVSTSGTDNGFILFDIKMQK